jgi:hypothetical protein
MLPVLEGVLSAFGHQDSTARSAELPQPVRAATITAGE